MKVYIASDHAGFKLKEYLSAELQKRKFDITDLGTHTYDPTDDYPDFIVPLAVQISSDWKKGEESLGVILGGSGQGEAIVANRFSHVRAGVYNAHNIEIIKLLRGHNDANVLSLGARFLTQAEAIEAVDVFLKTPFSEDSRHERRIKEIDIECK